MDFLFKTIICPLRNSCPDAAKKKGKAATDCNECPFAHHAMELEFPETLHAKIAATGVRQKRILRAGDSAALTAEFIPPSNGTWRDPKQAERDKLVQKTKPKLSALVARYQAPHEKELLAELKQIKEDMKGDATRVIRSQDVNFEKKSRVLKKAAILAHYGRSKEALGVIQQVSDVLEAQRDL